jgi:hypothetical protein
MVCLGPRNRVTVTFGSLLVLAAAVSCAWAVQASTTPVAPANAPAQLVGDLGDTRKLQFEGLRLFTPAQLRVKLECDLRYQAAARPSGDLEQFLRTVEDRVLAGYRYCGCPEAKVRATCDTQGSAVRVEIEEGRQYRKGQVEVAAPQQVDRAAIVRCLTTVPQAHAWRIERDGADLAKPKEGTIVWKPGDPVQYDDLSVVEMKAAVRRILAEQGFARAKFEVGLGPSDGAGNVNLRVEVENSPEPDRISGIEVVGLKRNSRQELLQFLHVAEGDPLNAALLERVYNQLKDCCRFWTYKVSAVIPGEKPNQDSMVSSVGRMLKIELDEYSEVPPLGKPLADVDEVLRKAGLLLASTKKSQDLVVDVSRLEDATSGINTVRLVVGSDGRAAVEAASAPKGAWDVNHALLVSPGALEIYDWKAQQKYVSPLPASMMFSLNIQPTRGEKGEYQLSAVVGGGAKGPDGDVAVKGPWQIQVEPVAVLSLAHRKEAKRAKLAIRGGELVYSDGHITVRLDAETGRLKELRCAAGNWIKRDFLVGRLEQGAFDKTAGTLRAKGQAYRNCYDERHKIASSWDFTLAQIEKQPIVAASTELTMYCHLARQLRSSQTLALLYERWVGLTGVDPTENATTNVDRCRQFNIPQTFSSKDDGVAATIDNGLFEVPAMADLMFPRGSWPWTVSREACFWKLREPLYGEQKEQAAALAANEFRRMAAGPIGPIGALALAQGMKQLESADAQQVTAIGNWGMSMLTQEAFAKDVSLVTEGDDGMALVCRAATEQLGKLSDQEQEMIIGLLPDGLQETAAQIAKRRKEHPNEPASTAIQATLVEGWNSGLRDVVQAQLRDLVTEVAKRSGEHAVK